METPPPPLDDSPKCPRCSLVGICLPDETNLLACEPGQDRGKVRRLLPARDDALPLYVQEQGCTVGKQGDELTVSKRGQVLRKIRLLDVSQVCLFGNAQLTAQALREVSAAGIPACHFSYGGWFHALTSGLVHKNVELRMRQFAVAADPRRSLRFARRWVVGKIKNSRTLLRRHLPPEARQTLDELKRLGQRAARAPNAPALLGIEGMAAKVYFAGFAPIAQGEAGIRHRRPQPPPAPRSGQRHSVVRLRDAGEGADRRAARGGLRSDAGLLSPAALRPAVVGARHGRGVPAAVGRFGRTYADQQRRGDRVELHSPSGAVAMTDAGRRAVIAAYERRMDTLVTHPVFGYRISYRRVLEVQARLLARALLGEISGYPFFRTR